MLLELAPWLVAMGVLIALSGFFLFERGGVVFAAMGGPAGNGRRHDGRAGRGHLAGRSRAAVVGRAVLEPGGEHAVLHHRLDHHAADRAAARGLGRGSVLVHRAADDHLPLGDAAQEHRGAAAPRAEPLAGAAAGRGRAAGRSDAAAAADREPAVAAAAVAAVRARAAAGTGRPGAGRVALARGRGGRAGGARGAAEHPAAVGHPGRRVDAAADSIPRLSAAGRAERPGGPADPPAATCW